MFKLILLCLCAHAHVRVEGVGAVPLYWTICPQMVAAVPAFILLVAVVVVVILLLNRGGLKLPPGPWGVPVFGYLPFFGKEPHVTFSTLRKTYGDVISISMGRWPAVIVSGRETIHKALLAMGDDYSGRPAFMTARMLNGGRSLGLGPFDEVWKMHRTAVTNAMNRFVNASSSLIEDVVCTEANTIIAQFKSHGKNSFSPNGSMPVAALSMIHQLCYGKDELIRENQDFKDALITERDMRNFKRGNPLDAVPWLRFLQKSKLSHFEQLVEASETRRSIKVEEHESTFDENSLKDITDYLIHAANKLSVEEQATGLDKQRITESLDFLQQANGTVASALEWLILLMAAYPEVQQKVFDDIEAIIGRNRLPKLEDRKKLPYVEATIAEAMRFAHPVPLAIPHSTTRDTKLNGYDIPQDTVVFISLYSIYMDEDRWGDPENFRPERFLTTEGALDCNLEDEVATFSLGPRRCIGETLADKEIFLFFTTLLQQLQLSKPPEHPQYSLTGYYDPTRKPDPFELYVVPRH